MLLTGRRVKNLGIVDSSHLLPGPLKLGPRPLSEPRVKILILAEPRGSLLTPPMSLFPYQGAGEHTKALVLGAVTPLCSLIDLDATQHGGHMGYEDIILYHVIQALINTAIELIWGTST